MELGLLIKECRERRGFSQKFLSKKSGYTTGTIAAWEEGVLKPSPGAVRDISVALGMPDEMLFFLAIDTDKLTGIDKDLAEALKRTTLDLLGAIKPESEIKGN